MPAWLMQSLFALLFFGLWGFFSKLALLHLDAKAALILQTIGVVVISFFMLKGIDYRELWHAKGTTYGILTGVAYGLGCFFYLMAADKGKLVTVVTLTALYPLITIFCSFVWLGETITAKQYIGIALALSAIVVMSI
jgi:transporter family protein